MPKPKYLQKDDSRRKKYADCSRAMDCQSCRDLLDDFNKERIQSALDALGPTATAEEIRALLIQGKPNPENS